MFTDYIVFPRQACWLNFTGHVALCFEFQIRPENYKFQMFGAPTLILWWTKFEIWLDEILRTHQAFIVL